MAASGCSPKIQTAAASLAVAQGPSKAMNLCSSGDIVGMAIASPRKVADEVERKLCKSVGNVLQSERQFFSLGGTLWPSRASKTEYLADHHSVHYGVRQFEAPVQWL